MQEPEFAEGALRHGRAELVEERIADIEPVDDALGAQVAVGQDRLRAVFGDDRPPAGGDGLDSILQTQVGCLAG